jgi:hypothetical protein
MPPAKKTAAVGSKPPRRTSSLEDLNAMIARVAPDVLELLRDGVPPNRATIVAALLDRHAKEDVKRAIARLAVLGRLEQRGSRYTLPAAEAA